MDIKEIHTELRQVLCMRKPPQGRIGIITVLFYAQNLTA